MPRVMTVWSRALRIRLLLALAVVTAAGLSLLPPIPQSLSYHDFADQRTLFGIPHALNVVSNLPFLFVGVAGVILILRPSLGATERHVLPCPASLVHGVVGAERWPWLIFFLGVAATGPGSSWYHLAPDNARLVWDRLPMTLAFMSLFAAMIAERIDVRAGLCLLGPLLLAGLGSVLYWHWTEAYGAGDLRPYAAVQFFPLVTIPLMLLLFPPRYTATGSIWLALAWYGLAKVFEELDGPIYALSGHIVSGHTLKHLAAAASPWVLLRMLRRRAPVDPNAKGLCLARGN
jgi:hypothetical protein